ncbi:MAG: hypothetical protein RMJ19_02495 [Gemmatales bacterium]|nr:hypothetical protein [Gemmatales bacterium]MCS7159317.1 hypothetical protein [Gemmatales bacterium]MDW8174517.1 hypothetical protein [Gemmatales bacterium]MDW8222537.1 hypothetical protein [Gemmatales bacterium]
MTYLIGRILQIIGLVLVPVAVAGNLAEIAQARFALSLRESLALAVVGMLAFYLGYSLQSRG